MDNADLVSPLASLKEGDEVIIRDVNERRLGGRKTGTVVKVGRKLLHVEQFGQTYTYEIDGGYRNDAYRHSWIVTPEMQAELDRRDDLLERLRTCNLEIRLGFQSNFTNDQIEAILRIIEPSPDGS